MTNGKTFQITPMFYGVALLNHHFNYNIMPFLSFSIHS